MTVRVHINRHIIAANRKSGERRPPITVMRGRVREYGSAVQLLGAARIVYRPDKPLPCGAGLWIEADDAVVTA